jgi:hypothetical protein
MFVGLFDLNENDIHNLRLNDKIYLRDSWWHINKIVDYNPTKDQLTKVELISADDDLELAPFRTSPIINTPPSGTPINQLIEKFYEQNNVNLSKGSVLVKGIGNVINEGLTGFVEGNYKVITTSGVNGLDGGENFANTDLTFTGNREHNTDGNSFELTTDNGAYGESYIYIDPNEVYLGIDTTYLDVAPTQLSIYANNFLVARAQSNSTFKTNFGRSIGRSVHSSAFTLNATHHLADCVTNTFTVSLPTASGISGQEYIIKNSGTGTITVDPDGAQTIDGAATVTLTQWESVTIVSTGTNWIITNRV